MGCFYLNRAVDNFLALLFVKVYTSNITKVDKINKLKNEYKRFFTQRTISYNQKRMVRVNRFASCVSNFDSVEWLELLT
jgi:hypothetical protein